MSPAAPFPTTLGTVSAAPMRWPEDDYGQGLVIDLPLTLDPSVKPWAEFYNLETLVDGVSHTRGGYLSEEGMSLAVCGETDTRVTENPHTVQLVGWSDVFDAPVIVSNTIVVDVKCPTIKSIGASDTADSAHGCALDRALPRDFDLAAGALGVLAFVVARRRRG